MSALPQIKLVIKFHVACWAVHCLISLIEAGYLDANNVPLIPHTPNHSVCNYQ